MPWKVQPVSQLRLALAHAVRTAGVPVTEACRRFGVSRKTAYKWLARFDADPAAATLDDRSRRPAHSPGRTADDVEAEICAARDRYGWGGRKLAAHLAAEGRPVPSARTAHAILARHGRVHPPAAPDDPAAAAQRFERPAPHDLWQADHKGPVEVGRRDRFTLAVQDDHSRFLVALLDCADKTMAVAWHQAFWPAFGEFGLPRAVLTDNAFGTTFDAPKTLSWFDAQLVRLGITPVHGRPYHPQTQGKVERLNGTLAREALPRCRRDCPEHFAADLAAFRDRYNHVRPHEALGDRPPVSRFAQSPRPRPPQLPVAESFYPTGADLRKVSTSGDVRWANARILAGRGLVGQLVRVEQREHEVALFYCWKQIRAIPLDRLTLPGML